MPYIIFLSSFQYTYTFICDFICIFYSFTFGLVMRGQYTCTAYTFGIFLVFSPAIASDLKLNLEMRILIQPTGFQRNNFNMVYWYTDWKINFSFYLNILLNFIEFVQPFKYDLLKSRERFRDRTCHALNCVIFCYWVCII